VSAALVSEDFFRVMGLQPSLGRAFRGDEWKPGGPKAAIPSLTLVGIALGLIGSLSGAKLLEGLLFGVTARDPVTFAGVPILLGLVAMVACYLPARRAASVDPAVALRADT